MRNIFVETIPVDCPDCGWSGDVPAEIDGETAYWVCPSTWCDRQLQDPSKMTDWFIEDTQAGDER